MEPHPAPACCPILPGYLLEHLARVDPALAAQVRTTLLDQERIIARREWRATRWDTGRPPLAVAEPAAPVVAEAAPRRSVHDAGGGTDLPGRLVRAEQDPPSGDTAADEVYDGLGQTWRLLHERFGRDSLDDRGMDLVATVHYGQAYENAFWDGQQMVFGDGDGEIIRSFTSSVGVIAHELGHGLVQFTAGLVYVAQPGALNEHVCDVVGSMVRQQVLGHTAAEADWLIGSDVFGPGVEARALRSLAEPGSAYDDPRLGRDPQPGHMRDYVELPHDAQHDNGGVHINSGIPNRAFVLAATALGGHSWERAGRVWMDVLTTKGAVPRDVDFAGFAEATVAAARARYGPGQVAEAVRGAWEQVGVLGSGSPGS